MKRSSPPFKRRHYAPDVILRCARWYCRYSLSYRDLEEMVRGRGLTADHVATFRRVQKYAPEINKRIRPHLKMGGTSHRLDETYVKVGKEWKHLYRAIDPAGNAIEFMLSAQRDVRAANRFFKKIMRGDHQRLPFTIGADKRAPYPEAFTASYSLGVPLS